MQSHVLSARKWQHAFSRVNLGHGSIPRERSEKAWYTRVPGIYAGEVGSLPHAPAL
jgi:hypothetical protein